MAEPLDAFEALCRAEYPHLVRTAYLITGDREEAVDVAQEAFTRAFERWRSVSAMERPGAWLQRVAANLSISWRRRRRFVADVGEVPEVGVSDTELADAELLVAMRSLTPSQRVAVVLRYYADLPVDEVARSLGKKPGTVRALTSQGIARLREFLGQEETDDARA